MLAPLLAIAIVGFAAQQPQIITNPSWARVPMAHYPLSAANKGITAGEVQLNCAVRTGGQLTDCHIISETPAGAGFGAAALAGSRTARLSEATVARAVSGSRTQFTVRFRLA